MRRTALVVVGGALWVLTSFLSWTSRGNGSTLSGVRLARWLSSGPSRPSWGPLAARLLFAVALIGCVVAVTCTVAHVSLRIARLVLGLSVLIAAVVFVVTTNVPLERWGAAAWCTIAGACALVVSSLPSFHSVSDRRST